MNRSKLVMKIANERTATTAIVERSGGVARGNVVVAAVSMVTVAPGLVASVERRRRLLTAAHERISSALPTERPHLLRRSTYEDLDKPGAILPEFARRRSASARAQRVQPAFELGALDRVGAQRDRPLVGARGARRRRRG